MLIGPETDRLKDRYCVDYVLDYSTANENWNLIQTGRLYHDPSEYPGDPIDDIDDVTLSGSGPMRYVRVTMPGATNWAHLFERARWGIGM